MRDHNIGFFGERKKSIQNKFQVFKILFDYRKSSQILVFKHIYLNTYTRL